jgi:hypothetical protein
LSELLAELGSRGLQVLQQQRGGDQPVEETLCFSVIPLAVAMILFALRARRWRTAETLD